MRILKLIGFFVLVVIVINVLSRNDDDKKSATAPPPPASPCKTDWTKCTDNEDMANNYDGWTKARVNCKFAATDLAKYGTPEWPWVFFFSSFRPGTSYSNGVATLIEPDAKFQNGFGAMVRSQVICEYDLRTNKVTNVVIRER